MWAVTPAAHFFLNKNKHMAILQEVPGNVNKISPELEKYLAARPLKGTAKYRMLNGTVNIDPKAVKGRDDILYPSITQLWFKDTIKDPGSKSNVRIGHIKEVDEKGLNHTFGNWLIPGVNRGIFTLTEGNLEQEEIYPIVELLNSNKSNPYRSENEPPLFERIDKVKEANVTLALNNKLFRAWQAIDIMQMVDKRVFHAANGGGFDDEESIVNSNLQELAKADPEKFYLMVDSPLTHVKSLVKQASDSNIWQYDAQQHRYLWVAGETIVVLSRVEGLDHVTQFAEWLQTNHNGGQIQKQAKNILIPEEGKKKK